VLERPALAEFVALTLNHGVYTTRAVAMASEAETTVAEWQPHLLIRDIDLDGAQIIALLSHRPSPSTRLPSSASRAGVILRPSSRPSRRAWTTS
jgi:hypothetical protein